MMCSQSAIAQTYWFDDDDPAIGGIIASVRLKEHRAARRVRDCSSSLMRACGRTHLCFIMQDRLFRSQFKFYRPEDLRSDKRKKGKTETKKRKWPHLTYLEMIRTHVALPGDSAASYAKAQAQALSASMGTKAAFLLQAKYFEAQGALLNKSCHVTYAASWKRQVQSSI